MKATKIDEINTKITKFIRDMSIHENEITLVNNLHSNSPPKFPLS